MLLQKSLLLGGFHPFSQHLQPQRARHGDDGGDDFAITALKANATHKALVDFQFVDGKALQR